jgi:Ca2+-binding EF-hand superfamily protein
LKGYPMKKLFVGGIVLATLFASDPVLGQSAVSAQPASPGHRPHGNFARNENRADVQRHVQKMFARLDINHDGFIARDEAASAEAELEAKQQQLAPKRAAKLFDRLDANHDGQITLAEVETAHVARYKSTDREANPSRPIHSRLFDRADTNKDGVVTRAEFDAARTSGRLHFRSASMRRGLGGPMFDMADSNKDGRVSLGEAQELALQHFDAADINHDGVLTPVERRQMRQLKRGGHRPS